MKNQGKNKTFVIQNGSVYLEPFIWKSECSDGHCVYLGIGREDGTSDQWRVHTFGSIIKAWDCLNKVKELLPLFQFDPSQNNDDIVPKFYDLLHQRYPELLTDNNDGSYYFTGDAAVLKEWLENTKEEDRLKIDTPPGIEAVRICPLYFAKYKVLELEGMMIAHIYSKCGNPNGHFLYTIGEEKSKLFGNETLIFDGYITAAYVADYINNEKIESLTQREVKDLLYKANKMQGKVLDTAHVIPLDRFKK